MGSLLAWRDPGAAHRITLASRNANGLGRKRRRARAPQGRAPAVDRSLQL